MLEITNKFCAEQKNNKKILKYTENTYVLRLNLYTDNYTTSWYFAINKEVVKILEILLNSRATFFKLVETGQRYINISLLIKKNIIMSMLQNTH